MQLTNWRVFISFSWTIPNRRIVPQFFSGSHFRTSSGRDICTEWVMGHFISFFIPNYIWHSSLCVYTKSACRMSQNYVARFRFMCVNTRKPVSTHQNVECKFLCVFLNEKHGHFVYAKRNSFVRLCLHIFYPVSLSPPTVPLFFIQFSVHNCTCHQHHHRTCGSQCIQRTWDRESIHSLCTPHSLLSILAIVVRLFACSHWHVLLRLWFNVCTLCTHIRHQTHIKRNEIWSKL